MFGALKELTPLAGELGVTLAVEPMHPGSPKAGPFSPISMTPWPCWTRSARIKSKWS